MYLKIKLNFLAFTVVIKTPSHDACGYFKTKFGQLYKQRHTSFLDNGQFYTNCGNKIQNRHCFYRSFQHPFTTCLSICHR